jgi:hypothetical protein
MKQILPKLMLTLSFTIIAAIAKAQPGVGISFLFSSNADVINFPAGGTTLVFPISGQDDSAMLIAPTGMNIPFAGANYQKVVISTNGWISLLPDSEQSIPASLAANFYLSSNQLSNNSSGYPIIAPY